MFEGAEADGLVHLMNMVSKRELEKYCRTFILKSDDFALSILVAQQGGFAPYKYASFREWVPDHLELSDNNLGAISLNGVGPMGEDAQKTMTKISQIFRQRRQLAAHLLYTEDFRFWFLFYFDQRDRETQKNHWK